jgi:hypothetical protein
VQPEQGTDLSISQWVKEKNEDEPWRRGMLRLRPQGDAVDAPCVRSRGEEGGGGMVQV